MVIGVMVVGSLQYLGTAPIASLGAADVVTQGFNPGTPGAPSVSQSAARHGRFPLHIDEGEKKKWYEHNLNHGNLNSCRLADLISPKQG